LVFIFFDIIFCILLLLKEKSSFFALKKSSKKKTPQFFSLRFFFACRASRERKRLREERRYAEATCGRRPAVRGVRRLGARLRSTGARVLFTRRRASGYVVVVFGFGLSSSSGVYYYLSTTRFCV
tara:strand:- start:1739 stop:2113 length:375 start_codon:yes stop_codon:yes gene_type:complete